MMVHEIFGDNAPVAYSEGIWKLRIAGVTAESRNGLVLTMEDPTILTIKRPAERVLFDPVRNANPFFHVMETVWMLAGSNDVIWIEYFNKRMREYADPGEDHHHGAYGYRWRYHFGTDQIAEVIYLLHKDPTTRRAVLSMWDPPVDLAEHNDLPCNTSICFRVDTKGHLCMTVFNRSNDFIWGMLGANVVHMTYLHELIASALGRPMGPYRVVSNNLHMYQGLPNFSDLINTHSPVDPYNENRVAPYPLLQKGENWEDILMDAETFVRVENPETELETEWFNKVAVPTFHAYMDRKEGLGNGILEAQNIAATDWRLACLQWIDRKLCAKEHKSDDTTQSA